jgi:DNA-binding IclR family transcriptional regulator
MTSENKYRIETLYEACRILQGMAESADPINPGEASQIAGVSQNTAFRMLETFTELGFVEKAPGGYVIGPEVARMWKKFRTDQRRLVEGGKKLLRDTQVSGEEDGGNGNGNGTGEKAE